VGRLQALDDRYVVGPVSRDKPTLTGNQHWTCNGSKREGGRSFPEGLKYIDSWVEPNFSRCFHLIECDDARLFQEWILQWRGIGTTLEIIPVVSSKETREVVAPHLDKP
jgi:hypothetical protein